MIKDQYSAAQVLAYAQRICPEAKIVECVDVGTPYTYAKLKDYKGRFVYAPICSFARGHYAFRSMLKVRKGAVTFGYSPNGQAGKNSKEIAFWGEQGPAIND